MVESVEDFQDEQVFFYLLLLRALEMFLFFAIYQMTAAWLCRAQL